MRIFKDMYIESFIMNFKDLPTDIQLYIFQINKQEDKHNKQLKKCMNEIRFLYHVSSIYFKYVKECIGVDVWEHGPDYEYWIDLEKSDSTTLDDYSVSYLQKKADIIGYALQYRNDNSSNININA